MKNKKIRNTPSSDFTGGSYRGKIGDTPNGGFKGENPIGNFADPPISNDNMSLQTQKNLESSDSDNELENIKTDGINQKSWR